MTDMSFQVCYIFGVTLKDMNEINWALKKKIDPNTFKFGLSTLHVWIRFLEFIFHLFYRLDVKKLEMEGKKVKNSFQSQV